jgi:acetyl-CoA acetyltransferase
VVAAPEAAAADEEADLRSAVVTVGSSKRRVWPDYQCCLDGAPPNGDGTGPDRSRADFTWCMIALDWGWGIEETADRLMELSDKARENGDDYALRTARNAAAAIERRRLRVG